MNAHPRSVSRTRQLRGTRSDGLVLSSFMMTVLFAAMVVALVLITMQLPTDTAPQVDSPKVSRAH